MGTLGVCPTEWYRPQLPPVIPRVGRGRVGYKQQEKKIVNGRNIITTSSQTWTDAKGNRKQGRINCAGAKTESTPRATQNSPKERESERE